MQTIIELFETSVKKYGDNPFMFENNGEGYTSLTYREIETEVYRFAAGLLANGVKQGDRVALLSEGRNDWLIAELAILYCGAINVPLSVKLDAEIDLKFRLLHSGSKYMIVSKHQIEKIRSIVSLLPELKTTFVLDEIATNKNEMPKSVLLQKGDEFLGKNRNALLEIKNAIGPNDMANISYTSGTTADPKGIILSHLNYACNVEQAASLMVIPEHYRTYTILPWDHAFAHTCCLYSFMYYGGGVAAQQVGATPIETLKNIPKNIKEIKPHIMMSVPALAKSFRKNIESGIKAKGKTTERLFNFALNTSYRYQGNGWDKGKGMRFLLKPLVALFDKILYSKIREGLGGNLKFFIGGGALLDTELQRFYYALGMPMLQGYGLSEAAPVISSNSLAKHKLGSSGFLVSDLELKIVDGDGNEVPVGEKGEIICKGNNVMLGYWNNPEATATTIVDGWLHTGDMGYLDDDGFLYVLGRFKSLLIASDGEKYSPEGIEEAIVDNSTWIDQAMFHNNQDPYTVALIVPNKMALKELIKSNGLSIDSEEGKELALKKIESELARFKPGGDLDNLFPSRWFPAAVAIMPETFNEENKLLNFSLKMVRGKIETYFAEEMKFLFSPQGKQIINDVNKTNIARFLSE